MQFCDTTKKSYRLFLSCSWQRDLGNNRFTYITAIQLSMDDNSIEIKERKRTFASMAFCEDCVDLPEGFEPGPKDIICGRGKLKAMTLI